MMDMSGEAAPYWDEALEGYRRVLGDTHPDTLLSINNMGYRLQSMGKLDEAEKHYREALEGCRSVLSDLHPQTLLTINNMGWWFAEMGKLADAEENSTNAENYYAEAENHYREALQGRRQVLGDSHRDTLASIHNVGDLLRELGQLEEAEALGAELVTTAKLSLAKGHPYTGIFLTNYGKCLAELERYNEAKDALLESYGILEAFNPAHERTIKAIQTLAELYDTWNEVEPNQGYDVEAARWRGKVPPG